MVSHLETTDVPLLYRPQYVTVRECVTTVDLYVQSRLSSEYWDGPASSHPQHRPRSGTDSSASAWTQRPHPPNAKWAIVYALTRNIVPSKKAIYQDERTEEVFVVTHIRRHPVVTYRLSEWDGTPIKGTFYEPDVQKVQVSDDSLFRVEKVLKRKGRHVLVRWKGWPAKYDSWIPAQPRHGTNKNKKNSP